MMRNGRKLAGAVALVALGVTAAPNATAATMSKATARRHARFVLLRRRDVPAQWQAQRAAQPTAADKADDRRMRECVGRAAPEAGLLSLRGTFFKLGTATAQSSAGVVRSDEAFDEDARAALGPKAEPCLRDALVKRFTAEGMEVKDSQIGRFRVTRHGTLTSGIRMIFMLHIKGQDVPAYLDDVFLGKAPVEATILFTNIGGPFDPLLEEALINRVGRRLDRLR
jgi:hypothetical protein